MERFPDDREALDFIVSRIADEGLHAGVGLSEIERKMLYFSETAWTLPDIFEIKEEFDRQYDQAAYERKISQLIRKAISRTRKQQPEEFKAWIQAVQRLRSEDRYILVMVDQARVGPRFRPSRPPNDLLKLWGTGIALVALFCGLAWFINSFFPGDNTDGIVDVTFWVAGVCVVGLYILLRLLIGPRRLNGIIFRATDWLFGYSGRQGKRPP